MRLGIRDLGAVLGLLAIAVVLPTAVALAAGAIDIPRNDDWSYRGIALHLFETGRLELDGSVATMLVGQILFAQPFLWLTGGAPWALTGVGLLAAVVTIVAGYLLVRRLVPAGRATLAILLLALFPGFLAYVPTYMSDLPAIGAEFVCLGLGIAAVSGGRIRGRWLLGSMVVGILGFTVREFALAAPASVLAAAILVQPRRWTPWLAGFAVLACCVAIYYLRTHLPGQIGVTVHPISDYFSDRVARAVSSLAFVLLPATVLAVASWWRAWRPVDVFVGAVLGSFLVRERLGDLIGSQEMPPVLLDNLASQWGTPLQFMTLGSRPLLFSDAVWSAVNGIALVATIALFAVGAGVLGFHARRALQAPRSIPDRVASPAGIVLMFCVVMGGGLVVFGLTGTMYDRYLWPLVPTVAGLLLMRPLEQERGVPLETATAPRPVGLLPVGATIATLVVLVAIGLPLMLNSAAFDRARWTAAERLADLGVPSESIDAGYEWVGYHATTRADFAHQVPAPTWWQGLWPSFRLCAFVATTPQALPGARLEKIDLYAYRLMLFVGPDEPLYLYRMTDPRCVRPAS